MLASLRRHYPDQVLRVIRQESMFDHTFSPGYLSKSSPSDIIDIKKEYNSGHIMSRTKEYNKVHGIFSYIPTKSFY
jgi:hypothetical protein